MRQMVLRHWWSWVFFFSSRRRHTRFDCDWSSDVCSSDLPEADAGEGRTLILPEPAIVEQSRVPTSWRHRLAQRAVAGGAAGIAAAAALTAHAPPVNPTLSAAVIAAAVALLPRLARLPPAIAGVGWLAAGPPPQPRAAPRVPAGLAP